jgi:hypothetical protein
VEERVQGVGDGEEGSMGDLDMVLIEVEVAVGVWDRGDCGVVVVT